MNTLRALFVMVYYLSLLSCSDDREQITATTTSSYIFRDGFETSSNQISELFASDNSRWTTIQQTNPTQGVNSISIITAQASEGEDALEITAYSLRHPSLKDGYRKGRS